MQEQPDPLSPRSVHLSVRVLICSLWTISIHKQKVRVSIETVFTAQLDYIKLLAAKLSGFLPYLGTSSCLPPFFVQRNKNRIKNKHFRMFVFKEAENNMVSCLELLCRVQLA